MRSCLIVVAMMVSGSARADDPQKAAEARRAADKLFVDAQRSHDDTKFIACGKAYLDLYNRDATSPDNDEVLFNAATCFQLGKSIGGAMHAYELVLKYYPRSKLASKALMNSAMVYVRIARFADAAARFEEYAQKYAGEHDAKDAMKSAITLRAAVGDTAKRIEDTRYFLRLYGPKQPDEAGEAAFALVSAYELADDRIKALREYLRTYGSKVAPERLAIAHAALGDALWSGSCPTPTTDGLCIKVSRDTKATRCAANAVRVDAVPRAARQRKEALAEYEQAIKIVEQRGSTDPAAVHAAAMAKIVEGDDELERLFDKPVPAALPHVQGWLAAETKLAAAANRAYEGVLPLKDPAASIAAAARLGQTTHAVSRALWAAEMKPAQCDKIKELAEPLDAHAATAFAVCADKAIQLGVFDSWTALCRRAGQTLDAKRFPPQEAQPELAFAIAMATEAPVTTSDARALATFTANDKAGWTDKTCRQSAAAFAAAAKTAPAAAGDALYMSGLSLHRCGLVDDARRAYEAALRAAPDHAASLSNLGELAWRAGQRDVATQSWERALKANGKLFAAHVNLAIAVSQQVRALPDKDPKRKQLAADAELHASSALAVDPDPLPLVVLAALVADGGDKRSRELSRAYLDQAYRMNDKSAAVHAASSVLAARRGEWTMAYAMAERAVALDPRSDEAQRIAGLVGVRVGKFDAAAPRLAALRAQPYAVLVARGIAARALGDAKAAEGFYLKAIQLDPARAEAHYDLGLLYELHLQPVAPRRAIEEYRRATNDPSLDAAERIKALDKP